MCFAALATVLAFAAQPQQPYVWPLDLPQAVTSSFGEYRSGRFHAGLDLRTGGVGHEVRAPYGGSVSRVRCSPWGYGKAVYLKLDDGNTCVFGHLADFAPELRAYVREAQHKAQNYTVNLYPPEGKFRFEAGEVVAFSGDTGAGPPHLHYELRDELGRPFNPRLAGVTWPDATIPAPAKLAIVPKGPGSSVNGDVMPRVLECKRTAAGEYRCETVRARGRVGVALDLIDPANNGANKLGVHTLRTFAGGVEQFAVTLDRISYEETRHEIVSYHPFLMDEGRFLLQWRWPGNACNAFQYQSEGWIEIGDEPLDVRVEAVDFLGNQATVAFTVEPATEDSAVTGPTVPEPAEKGRLDIDCAGTWLIVTARFPAPEPVEPVLRVQGAIEECAFRRVGQRTFRAAVAPAPGVRQIAIAAGHPRLDPQPETINVFRAGDTARKLGAAGAELTVQPGSPYGVLFLRAELVETTEATPAPRRGPALRLWPEQTPLDAPVELTVPVPSDSNRPDRLALYRRGKNGWSMIDTRRNGNSLVAELSAFGEFALLEDVTPPVIRDIAVSGGTVSARVADAASGIAKADITCNGQWLLTAYDPDAGRVKLEPYETLPPPPWEFAVTATDKAGNSATRLETSENKE